MRVAALIFGLLAGILGAAVLVVGNLETGLLTHPSFAGHDGLVAKIVVYAIPVIGLLGGLIALFRPRIGGVLMLLSAVAWLAIAWIAGHGAVLFAAAPFTFVAAGAVVALTARRREPSRDLALVSQDRDWDDEDELAEDEEEPVGRPGSRGDYGRDPRLLRGRSEPDFGSQLERRVKSASPADYANEEVEPELPPDAEEEDYIDAEEAAADGYEDEAEAEDVAEAEPDDAEPVEQPLVAPRVPPARGGTGGKWSLPDPQESPAPQRTRQRYIPEEQRTPARRRQLPPRPETRPPAPDADDDAFDVSDDDYAAPRRGDARQARGAYRDYNAYEEAQQEERRRSPLRGLLRFLVLMLFVLVVGGIAAAIYFDYERGPNSILFGSRQPAAASTAAPKPAAPAKVSQAVTPPAPTPAASTPAPAPTPSATAPTPVPLATPDASATTDASAIPPATGDSSTPDAAPAPTPDATALPADTTQQASNAQPTFDDPIAYCRAVGNADAPDSTYTGPATPTVVLKTLGLSAATDQVHWRCSDQRVVACNAKNGSSCNLTPTVDLMISYCSAHPDAKNLPAPNGSWNCNGKRPSIPANQKWPVDARGFFPGAWKPVPAPPANG